MKQHWWPSAERWGAYLRVVTWFVCTVRWAPARPRLPVAWAQGLDVAKPAGVCSPTYTLAMHHRGPVPLMHVDLCRLGEGFGGGHAAFEALGLEADGLVSDQHALVVEWAELWPELPSVRLDVSLDRRLGTDDRRSVEVVGRGDAWVSRLNPLKQRLQGL